MALTLRDRRGFTLTELLVVVAIIVLLTSIVVPNIAGRLSIARMHAAEDQIGAIEVALARYHADFGRYPGDEFPSEDRNNNGILDSGEDGGVDVDRDGTDDYATVANGRIDKGDGVVNIDDLEWALRTTQHSGPYMESIPLDPWKNKYYYYAPLDRPTGANNTDDFLYIDPATMRSEDVDEDGRFDGNKKARDGNAGTEDIGIGQYATTAATGVAGGFVGKWAGEDNGILEFGDDDNKNGTIEYYQINTASPNLMEYGNRDLSPDGLAQNIGYYIFSAGRDRIVHSFSGYEDVDWTTYGTAAAGISNDGPAGAFNEDLNGNGNLDTGYEDTGVDGIPRSKDAGEDDLQRNAAGNEDFNGPYNDSAQNELDIGGDDINSWNSKTPWRDHNSYGG